MNKEEMIELLKTDVEGWNKYISQTTPPIDLENSDLSNIKLTGILLSNTVLWHSSFENSKMENANFKKAKLLNVNFKHTTLTSSSFAEANLQGATFRGANLSNVDFTNAQFYKTFFTSRSQLNELENPLTPAQLAHCIFIEEQQFYQEEFRPIYTPQFKQETVTPTNALGIKYTDHSPWTPRDMSIFMMSIQSAYSNLLYLYTTDEHDLSKIESNLSRNSVYPPLEHEICISSIHSGSLETIITQLVTPEVQTTALAVSTPYILKKMGEIISVLSQAAQDFSNLKYSAQREESKIKNQEADTRLKNAQAHEKEINNQLALVNNLSISIEEAHDFTDRLSSNHEFNQLVDQISDDIPKLSKSKRLITTAVTPLQIKALTLAKSGKSTPKITLPIIEGEPAKK
ncbi:pentapeptide repeat-containing protein [Maridesulfovibrio sp.]|uniref:pentapeptide repeat-containing protein n=1 Tax=Maridesulfovibrio sp. TaxID=2795000 RepID=UPI002AA7BFCF|nr:pentapeptide repeat-containing protein [Maridesulfovibrio sp.]